VTSLEGDPNGAGARDEALVAPCDKENTPVMAATLQEMLLAPQTQPQVVADCETLVGSEVGSMSGITGTAVKLAYKTVRTFSADHIHYMIETLLPRMTEELQPYWADFTAGGGGSFGDYLAKREDEVSEALLSITDERGRNSARPVIVKAYNTVRGGAAKQVKAALPQVGAMVQKYS
jgi:hypothetical protein